jgi:hypothetical protein
MMWEDFDPEKVKISNVKITLGEVALAGRAKAGDIEAFVKFLVERTDLTEEQVCSIPADERLTKLANRVMRGVEEAQRLLKLEQQL